MHFRLFVGDGLDLATAAGGTADDLLAGLETNWNDTETLLHMPASRVDYYLLSAAAVADRCGGNGDVAACEQDRAVFTTRAVDQHELNHAYMELHSSRRPAPLLLEGLADAIGCGETGSPSEPFAPIQDWRQVLDYDSYADVYAPGRELVRYLVLSRGVDSVISYYLQAPDTRDATTFADNFLAFWGDDVDAVWAKMQVAQPSWGPPDVLPICACSLPAWTASSTPVTLSSSATSPYWTWPQLNGDTAVWAGNPGAVALRDCPEQNLAPLSAVNVVLARIDGPLYVQASGATVARDHYIADDCASASAYVLPSALLSTPGGGTLGLELSRPAATATTVYLELQAPSPALLSGDGNGTMSLCSSCDAGTAVCQPLPRAPALPAVSGELHLRWDLPAANQPYAATYLDITPP